MPSVYFANCPWVLLVVEPLEGGGQSGVMIDMYSDGIEIRNLVTEQQNFNCSTRTNHFKCFLLRHIHVCARVCVYKFKLFEKKKYFCNCTSTYKYVYLPFIVSFHAYALSEKGAYSKFSSQRI